MALFCRPTAEEFKLLFRVFGIKRTDSNVVVPEIKIAREFEKLERRVAALESRLKENVT